MAKFLIWTWTRWRNQQTNAHQKQGDRHDQTEVGAHEVFACGHVALLDAVSQVLLLFGREQGDFVDLLKICLQTAF